MTRGSRDSHATRSFLSHPGPGEHCSEIRQLREQSKLRQIDLAKKARLKQSAVSRIEQAGYSSWTLKTLLRADALDARLRVVFELSVDVIARYARPQTTANGQFPKGGSRIRRSQVLRSSSVSTQDREAALVHPEHLPSGPS